MCCCILYCVPCWYDSAKTVVRNLKLTNENSLHKMLDFLNIE